MQSAREEIRDLERVRYVTENYENLQGLTRVPIGLALLVVWMFFLLSGFEVSNQPVADILIMLSLLVSGALVLLFFRIKRYYRQRYGQVRVVPSLFSRRRLFAGSVALAILLIASYLALWVGVMENLDPLPFVLFGVGLMEAADRWPERRFRPHYFFAGVAMIFSGLILWLLVLLDVQYSEVLIFHLFAASIIFALIVGGILDHLLLVRTMKRLPEDSNAVG